MIAPAGVIIERLFRDRWNEALLLLGGTIATLYLLRLLYTRIRRAGLRAGFTPVEPASPASGVSASESRD
jgi:hypothetical protein